MEEETRQRLATTLLVARRSFRGARRFSSRFAEEKRRERERERSRVARGGEAKTKKRRRPEVGSSNYDAVVRTPNA